MVSVVSRLCLRLSVSVERVLFRCGLELGRRYGSRIGLVSWVLLVKEWSIWRTIGSSHVTHLRMRKPCEILLS